MIQVSADHDIAVAQDDTADVVKDDHPAGPVAAELMDVRGARRSGAEEDWDRFEAEITAMDAEVGDDPVGLYMREIGRVGLLTAAEERTLAAEIELASHLEDLERELVQGLGDDCGDDAGVEDALEAEPWEMAMLLPAFLVWPKPFLLFVPPVLGLAGRSRIVSPRLSGCQTVTRRLRQANQERCTQ